MRLKLKPLAEQTLLITGASSGIGLATARRAAGAGARVLLVARDEAGLQQTVDAINAEGGTTDYAVADVNDRAALARAADLAEERFGPIDTWINNAGISVYGRLTDVSLDDARRVFDTNYWGVVHGSLLAVERLRARGGALINLGSVVSERSIPLQGHYAATKHAIKAFTDALRMELEEAETPISVTLIKPGSINTPYPAHAKNYMDRTGTLPPPVYDPDVVARAILTCAEKPQRDVVVGGGGKMLAAMDAVAPRFADKFMEGALFEQQQKDAPADGSDSLYAPAGPRGRIRGDYEGHTMRSSLYTQAVLHPMLSLGLGAIAGVLATALLSQLTD